jgi:hypothetical protein
MLCESESDNMPLGLVKALNPEMHSGHLKLQLVVGSKFIAKG